MTPPISAVALVVDEHKIIAPLEADPRIKIKFIHPSEFQFDSFHGNILLTVSDWRPEIAEILIEAKKRNIPTLLFQDGTLDWIIQNQGDAYGGNGGPTHFQPILTNKIAVMGAQSARVIASWNNDSKVEVTGFPILQREIEDALIYNKTEKPVSTQEVNVLITSPRLGWFCEDHKQAFVAALKDLKSFFERDNRFVPTWRLSRNLAELVGVKNEMKEKESHELVPLIQQSDLVISAQSTVVVEAMLHHKPVAILDYLNSPQYYSTSWLITSKNQIEPVIDSMLKKEANRMLFQHQQLADILYYRENSITRSVDLIIRMVEYSDKHNSVDFPANLLGFNSPFQTLQHSFTLSEIYPNLNITHDEHNQDFKLILNRYKHENKLLKEQLKKRSLLQTFVRYKKKLIG